MEGAREAACRDSGMRAFGIRDGLNRTEEQHTGAAHLQRRLYSTCCCRLSPHDELTCPVLPCLLSICPCRTITPYEDGSACNAVAFDYSGQYLAVGGADVKIYGTKQVRRALSRLGALFSSRAGDLAGSSLGPTTILGAVALRYLLCGNCHVRFPAWVNDLVPSMSSAYSTSAPRPSAAGLRAHPHLPGPAQEGRPVPALRDRRQDAVCGRRGPQPAHLWPPSLSQHQQRQQRRQLIC
jgi:hypothetical protein